MCSKRRAKYQTGCEQGWPQIHACGEHLILVHFIGRKKAELAIVKSCSSATSVLFGFWGFTQKPCSLLTATTGWGTRSFPVRVIQNFSNSFDWKKLRPWIFIFHLLRSTQTLARLMPTGKTLDPIITCLWSWSRGFPYHITTTHEPSPTRVNCFILHKSHQPSASPVPAVRSESCL